MNADGTGQTSAQRSGSERRSREFAPAFSPDGTKIAFKPLRRRSRWGGGDRDDEPRKKERLRRPDDADGRRWVDQRAFVIIRQRGEDRLRARDLGRQPGVRGDERERERADSAGDADSRTCYDYDPVLSPDSDQPTSSRVETRRRTSRSGTWSSAAHPASTSGLDADHPQTRTSSMPTRQTWQALNPPCVRRLAARQKGIDRRANGLGDRDRESARSRTCSWSQAEPARRRRGQLAPSLPRKAKKFTIPEVGSGGASRTSRHRRHP